MSGQRVTTNELENWERTGMLSEAAKDLLDARREAARLRAALVEAQECIDYGTRAGGAAEVLAHIATVLKGDGHATVTRASDESWPARRAELVSWLAGNDQWSSAARRKCVAAALDRAFEFDRGMR